MRAASLLRGDGEQRLSFLARHPHFTFFPGRTRLVMYILAFGILSTFEFFGHLGSRLPR
jgi:hypothetical protein